MTIARTVLTAAALAVALAAPALAQPTTPIRETAAELAKRVETPVNGVVIGVLQPGGPGARIVVARRTQAADYEAHDGQHEFVVLRSGRATFHVGGRIDAPRQISPGEWRGAAAAGTAAYELAPGDVLSIPAGTPHQVAPSGGDVTYLSFKWAK